MDANLLGVLWALVAMVAWGFGDFLIQKNVRKIGIWRTLFFIGIIGTVTLLPLVYRELDQIHTFKTLLFPLIAFFVTLVSSLFDFEALKQGKLAIMEPILSVELPLAAIFAALLWDESISFIGWLLIIAIFIGITLAATQERTHLHYHKRIFEKGVIFALIAAIGMALTDLFMGISAQETTPLFTVWSVWLMFTVACFIYIARKGELKNLVSDVQEHPWAILMVGIFDTLGWVGFCFATERIPIGIATAIGQSFIIITILLGIFVNRERIKQHQIWGIACTVAGVIALAWITG